MDSSSPTDVLIIAVGQPIPVSQKNSPTQSDIDELHHKYMDNLSHLFDNHKQRFGLDVTAKLEFV